MPSALHDSPSAGAEVMGRNPSSWQGNPPGTPEFCFQVLPGTQFTGALLHVSPTFLIPDTVFSAKIMGMTK